jgi:pimeloyl-ACP methyl ester carboxylesterase
LTDCADQNGWVIVAPSFAYRDYMDPEQVRLDDRDNLPRVLEMLDALPLTSSRGAVQFKQRVLLYGFSRGAQGAQRFALFYPERVAAAAILSGGSYTLPKRTARVESQEKPLNFPYGVADLDRYAGHQLDVPALLKVPVWVGVGATDTLSSDVPRPWDPYLGRTRVERARAMAEVLRGMGVNVRLEEFTGAGHEETAQMRSRICDFLRAGAS